MSDLISRSALLQVMDKRYKEKKDFVQDNLAEGFLQMEKLINEQPSVEAISKEKVQEIVERLEDRIRILDNTSDINYPSVDVAIKETERIIQIVKEVGGIVE